MMDIAAVINSMVGDSIIHQVVKINKNKSYGYKT